MEKGTKVILWSIGGIAVATGLFFGIRAIVVATKPDGGGIVPPPQPPLPNTPPAPPKEPKVRGGLFPIKFGDRGEHVEEWQRAINKWDDDWCSFSACHGGTWRSKIPVDGVFGEQTALYTNCHYPETDCALCSITSTYPIGSADHSKCTVTYDKFKSVVGSSKASKYKDFSGAGYSNAEGGGRGCCSRLASAQCVGGMECVSCSCQPVVDKTVPDNRGVRGNSRPNTLKRFSGELSDDDYLNMLRGFRG